MRAKKTKKETTAELKNDHPVLFVARNYWLATPDLGEFPKNRLPTFVDNDEEVDDFLVFSNAYGRQLVFVGEIHAQPRPRLTMWGGPSGWKSFDVTEEGADGWEPITEAEGEWIKAVYRQFHAWATAT